MAPISVDNVAGLVTITDKDMCRSCLQKGTLGYPDDYIRDRDAKEYLTVPETHTLTNKRNNCRGMWKARSTGQIGRTLSTTDLTEDSNMADDYLANECREFYLTRRRKAEEVKERLREDQTERGTERHTNLDDMMADLRKDMASLMERDLALMEQLLKMNDTIQELKWQSAPMSAMSMSMSLCSRESLTDSNCTLASSTVSLPSEDSGLSGYESAPSVDNMKILSDFTCKTCPKQKQEKDLKKTKEHLVQMKMDQLVPMLTVSNVIVDQKGYHSTQSSIDSGCGDVCNYQCQEVF